MLPKNNNSETILVTGAAGFIGAATVLKLLEENYNVIGVDNLNDYYDVSLKEKRIQEIDNLSKSDISLQKIEYLSKKGPLFINFTADWCITCKVNEQIALSGNDFKSMIARQNINYLKIDWTNKDPNINKLIETYGRSGIPLYVFYPYEEYGPVILPEVLNKSILEKYLRDSY